MRFDPVLEYSCSCEERHCLVYSVVQDQHFGRFIASYRKQFAEQEFRRLQSSQGGGVNIIASCSATGEQTSRATCVVGCLEMGTASPKDDMVEVYIKNVVVIPDYRRQGIARRMLEYAEVEAKGMGAVTLSVEVELANTNAVSLYQGFGFNRVDDGSQSENKSQTRVGRLVTLSKAI